MDAKDKIYQYREKLIKQHNIIYDNAEEIREEGYTVCCLCCGKDFIVKKDTKGLFCSRKCQIDNRKRTVERPCPICGKLFTVPFYRRRVKCCSKDCSIKVSARAKIGKKRSEEFRQKISDSQKATWKKRRNGEVAQRDTSIWHTEKWKKEQSERIKTLFSEGKIRKTLQKVFKEEEEQIIEYYLDFYSCHKIAKMIGFSKTAVLCCLHRNHIPIRLCKGEFHPQWKGGRYKNSNKNYGTNWHEVKSKVLERDNFSCCVCGKKANLEVHHIEPIRFFKPKDREEKGNNLDNLITLCLSCHRFEHEKLRKEIKNVI